MWVCGSARTIFIHNIVCVGFKTTLKPQTSSTSPSRYPSFDSFFCAADESSPSFLNTGVAVSDLGASKLSGRAI